jgi:hypothetical protein
MAFLGRAISRRDLPPDLVLFNILVIFGLRSTAAAAKMGPMALPLWLAAVAVVALARLRPAQHEPHVIRVPGGRAVLWVVALMGFGTTAVGIATSLIPPPDVTSASMFLAKLLGGLEPRTP